MFESESNWSMFNKNLIDYVKFDPQNIDSDISFSVCSSCGNRSFNPSSDHFFQVENLVLCELCYLDYNLMKNN